MSACSQQYKEIEKIDLLNEVHRMKVEGYRLGQISCTTLEKFDLLYSFAKDDDLLNLRVTLGFDEEIDSISCFYSFAYLYENEMKDLFGVKVININLDFKGNLYKTSIKHPFAKEHDEQPKANPVKKGVKANG